MSALSSALAWLGAQLVPGTAFLLAAFLIDALIARRVAPQWRAALWWVVGARLVVPVSWTTPWGLWSPAPASATSSAVSDPMPWAFAWAGGAVVLLGMVVVAVIVHARRLRHTAHAPTSDVLRLRDACAARVSARPVRTVLAARTETPYVFGLVRPTIVIPADMPAHLREPALAHELTHVRRRDLWAQALWTLLACVYWFHPLVWLARRRAHRLRELCCDAQVVARHPGGSAGYRRALIELATSRSLRPAAALAMGHSRSALLERVEALERRSADHHRVRTTCGACAALVIVAVVLPMAPDHAPLRSMRAEAANAEARLAGLLAGPQDTGGLQLRYATLAVMEHRSRLARAAGSN